MNNKVGKSRKRGYVERSRARRIALQATYQWLMTGDDPEVIAQQYLHNGENGNFDRNYFTNLFVDAINAQHEIFSTVDAWLDRPLAQIDPVEKSVLQISCFEMKHRKDVPYKVIINEAVELTKTFGAEESHKYINAVMDKAAVAWRREEVQAGSK